MKFKLSLAIARRTFYRLWIALYQISSSSMRIQKIQNKLCKYSRFPLTSNQMSGVFLGHPVYTGTTLFKLWHLWKRLCLNTVLGLGARLVKVSSSVFVNRCSV